MKDHRQRLQWPTTGKVQFHVKKNEIWRMGRFPHFVVLSNVIWWKCVPKKNGQGVSACTRADRAPMKEAVAFCRRIARSSRALPKKRRDNKRRSALFPVLGAILQQRISDLYKVLWRELQTAPTPPRRPRTLAIKQWKLDWKQIAWWRPVDVHPPTRSQTWIGGTSVEMTRV